MFSENKGKSYIYSVASYLIIFVLLGVPLWWKTTDVYRVVLPFQNIMALSALQIIHKVPIKVVISDPVINVEDFQKQILEYTDEDISFQPGSTDTQRSAVVYEWEVRKISDIEQHVIDESASITELELKLQEHLENDIQVFQVIILPEVMPLLRKPVTIGAHRIAFIKYQNSLGQQKLIEQVKRIVKDVIVQENKLVRLYGTSVLTNQTLKERMRSLGATPELDVVFSLIVPEPLIYNVQWNMKKAVEDYVNPFLQRLSNAYKVNVKSQILYLTTLNVSPKYDPDKDEHVVTFDELPLVINPLEAKLGSHVSINPVLNFVVYIPPSYQMPLQVYLDTGEKLSTNAFSSPRWGGFLIYNLNPITNTTKTPITVNLDMKHVMEVFLTQMRLLIGLSDQVFSDHIELLPSFVVSDWEMDYLYRLHAQEQLAQAISSLTSLSQLLGKISNIVIQDDVGAEIYSAVQSIDESASLLKKGYLVEALSASTKAFLASERAFFDPSLLALLYFPDDQKYAIYIPLFLPVSIPVILSLQQLYKALKSPSNQPGSHEHDD